MRSQDNCRKPGCVVDKSIGIHLWEEKQNTAQILMHISTLKLAQILVY